jgi:hypothetical protein
VEGHRSDLEEQADREQAGPGEKQRVAAGLGADRVGDAGEGHRARVPVEQGHAVQEERRREGSEQEVLE